MSHFLACIGIWALPSVDCVVAGQTSHVFESFSGASAVGRSSVRHPTGRGAPVTRKAAGELRVKSNNYWLLLVALVANCSAAKDRKGKARQRDENRCMACGMMHNAVNCDAVRTWRQRAAGTRLSRQLLHSVIVPENNCVAEEVDLDTKDARMVAGRMYQQHHQQYGAFVAKPKTPLTSQPEITLHGMTIQVCDQVLKRPSQGVFHLNNVERPLMLCSDFVKPPRILDKKLLQDVDQTTDSFWHRALDQYYMLTIKGANETERTEPNRNRLCSVSSAW